MTMRLRTPESPVDPHTPAQRAFLAHEYENCETYADGLSAADAPLPATLSWEADKPGGFCVKVSENADLSDPRVYTTDACSLDVFNLKIGARYYWSVDGGAPATFVTLDAPPRNLKIDGVKNARDLGGWKTDDGKRVRQGLLFRTSAFDYYSNSAGETKDLVTPAGKRTLTDLLGIKTEIDLRVDHDGDPGFPPEGKTESALGAGVRYLHCPILLGPENYLNSVESLRTVFRTLADPASYPVAYHCAVGADRTGFLSYLILGLLGVGRKDVLRDYLFTNFSEQGFYRPPINRGYKVTIDGTEGKTLRDKVRRVLTERIGVPEETLDKLVDILTE